MLLRQACNRCRRRKVRCTPEDGTVTAYNIEKEVRCRRCEKAGAACTYISKSTYTRGSSRPSQVLTRLNAGSQSFSLSSNSPSTSRPSPSGDSTEHDHRRAVTRTPTGVSASSTGFEAPVEQSAVCISSDVTCQPTQPPPFPVLPSYPLVWPPLGVAHYHFTQSPGMIDSTLTTSQDPTGWGVPYVPNLYSAIPQSPAGVDSTWLHDNPRVTQPHPFPILSEPPQHDSYPPIAHHYCALSEPAGSEQLHRDLSCAFKQANTEWPDSEQLKHERKRAGLRAVSAPPAVRGRGAVA
jgi:hypothetical protein